MRFSSTYIPTLKESPSEAEVVSHKLLLRAGMVRKLTSGVYIYLPLGLKALENVQRVVREEMDAAGFSELLMPMVIPGDLWKETNATTASAPRTRKSSPTSSAAKCAPTASCPCVCTRSRPSSATRSVPASA